MALEVGLDLSLLCLIGIAIGITATVLAIAEFALSTDVGTIPVLGSAWNWLWSHVVTYARDVEDYLIHAAGNVWSGFINNLWECAQLVFGLTVLLGDSVYLALSYLWRTSLPALLSSVLTPIHKLIAAAHSLASAAESDAQTAIHKAQHIIDVTVPDAISIAEHDAARLATAAKNDAISYADTAVAKLKAAEDAAVSAAVSLATTAEHDATQAYKDATAYVDSLVKPLGADLSDFEQYVKSLGVPGIAAGVAALSAVVSTVLAETGLGDPACRSKASQICSTDPNVWSNLLGLLAAVGIGFDFRELVKVANDLAPEAAAIVKSAA